jgi:hypothetical protein
MTELNTMDGVRGWVMVGLGRFVILKRGENVLQFAGLAMGL